MSLPAELTKAWAFACRGGIMNRRNVFAIFEMVFWPLIGLLSVGYLTRFLQLETDTISFVLTGAVAMNTIQIAQLDISYALLYDVWSKSLKHEFIAPIRLWHIVAGSGLVALLRGFIVYVIMVGLSVWLFAMDLGRPGWLGLALFFAGLFLMAAIEGAVVLSLVLTFGHRAEVTAWAISYLVLLLCGLYYPVSLLPTGVQWLAHNLPLTYFMEYFRSYYGFAGSVTHPLWYGFLLSVGYLLACFGLLRLSLKASIKRGTLLKLSE